MYRNSKKKPEAACLYTVKSPRIRFYGVSLCFFENIFSNQNRKPLRNNEWVVLLLAIRVCKVISESIITSIFAI